MMSAISRKWSQLLAAASLALSVSACGSQGAIAPPTAQNQNAVPLPGGSSSVLTPFVVQNGTKPINWTQFTTTLTNKYYYGLVQGPDKNTWFTDYYSAGLGNISMAGKYKETISSIGHNPYGLVVGADGKFYMATNSSTIVRSTTTGTINNYTIPSGDSVYYQAGMTKGPDNNVWMVELSHIAKITTGGVITEKAYPSGTTTNYYGGVTTGPDGNIWFTEYSAQKIGKLVPATMAITEYSLSTLSPGCNPQAIVSAADGNLWFNCGNYFDFITTAGVPSVGIPNAWSTTSNSEDMIIGPDGKIWFVGSSYNIIGQVDVFNGSITAYAPPSTVGAGWAMASGSDGNIWVSTVNGTGHIAVYIIRQLVVTPNKLTFATTGVSSTLTVSEPLTAAWTATSSSPGVASVAAGGTANTFKVTANGIGTTTVTIKDAIGNSFAVKVTVT